MRTQEGESDRNNTINVKERVRRLIAYSKTLNSCLEIAACGKQIRGRDATRHGTTSQPRLDAHWSALEASVSVLAYGAPAVYLK
jgi:hypothetical protein